MAGGCCGTTPEHIHAISEKLSQAAPGEVSTTHPALRLQAVLRALLSKENRNLLLWLANEPMLQVPGIPQQAN